MPLLESTSYEIGYVIGQVIGVLMMIAIPAGIGYVIYRATRKKPEMMVSPPAGAALDVTQSQGRQCPNCRNQAQPNEAYCRNCGHQLEPIP